VAALLALAIAVGAAGCGEDEGVADGATVTVYVEASLCEGLDGRVVKAETADGSVQIRSVCLAKAGGERGVELATVGANARRAIEDSTTIAYLGEPGTAARFSRPILEAAGVAFVPSSSGTRAMRQILDAVSAADPNSLRNDVRETLDPQ
jgi:hypothetical protein